MQIKLICFNPQYSVNVETNIGKKFLKFIEQHFPKTNKFHKIFNKNNVKVSYSGLPNFANMIKLHISRILSEEKTRDQPKCNCRQKDTSQWTHFRPFAINSTLKLHVESSWKLHRF